MTPRDFARDTDADLSTGHDGLRVWQAFCGFPQPAGGTHTHFPFRQDLSGCPVIRALVAQHLFGWDRGGGLYAR